MCKINNIENGIGYINFKIDLWGSKMIKKCQNWRWKKVDGS
jgi:hypothetical protein